MTHEERMLIRLRLSFEHVILQLDAHHSTIVELHWFYSYHNRRKQEYTTGTKSSLFEVHKSHFSFLSFSVLNVHKGNSSSSSFMIIIRYIIAFAFVKNS